jgi:RNA polymerase primary sigma factor
MDILRIYMNQLEKCRVLSRGEEERCAREAKNGDEKAVEKLIVSNLKFVVAMAMKYRNLGLPLGDLINEGNIGLIKALKRFDPDRGLRFVSFARWWIRHYILKAVFEQSSSIRLPLRYASSIIRGGGGKGKLEELRRVYKPLSLDQLLSDEGDSETVMAFVGSERYGPPEEQLMKGAMSELIEDAMLKLKPIEREVLRRRYGLDGREPLTLHEIGKRQGLTKERIRQIMYAALAKIRYPMEKREIQVFVNR